MTFMIKEYYHQHVDLNLVALWQEEEKNNLKTSKTLKT